MKFFPTCFSLIFSTLAFGQTTPFVTTVGETGEQLSGIGSIVEGGHVYMIGNIQNDTTVGFDVLMAKLDLEGDLLWTKSFDFEKTEVANDFIFKNGAFIVVGESIQNVPFDRNGFVLRLGLEGEVLDYEVSGSNMQSEQYQSVTATPNGFVVTGYVSSSNGNDVLVRHEGAGLLDSWIKVYGEAVNDIGMAVEPLANGHFLVVGDRQVEPDKYNPFAMVLDARGDLLYDKVIASDFNGGCKNLIMVNESEALVVGEMSTPSSSSFDVMLAKVDTTAETLWLNYVPGTDSPEAGFGICQQNSGSFFVTGYGWNEATANSDILVASIDGEGNLTEKDFFGGTGLDIAYDIKPLPEGGYLATGKSANGGDQVAVVIYGKLPLATAVGEGQKEGHTLDVFPNPVRSGGIVQLSLGWENAQFEWFGMEGHLMEKGRVVSAHLSANFPPGNYFLRVSKDGKTAGAPVQVF